MCDFKTASPPTTVLDPRKRVRYLTGLVMGEEEFQQDQLYFMSRDELHQRSLHGYGKVSGLGVSSRVEAPAAGPEVVVAAGLAVNPRGESICVHQAQCANLNEWLETHRDELLGSPPAAVPGTATVHVVLCARDCETDSVPILGDPCRTLEDATAFSRIADDFELSLRLTPPPQIEEEAIRAFGALLRSIEITDEASDYLTPDELADLVRDLIPSGSPPGLGAPDLDLGSPPGPLPVHPEAAAAALSAAYRVWISEVRPSLLAETGACEAPRDGEGGRCLLLASLTFDYDEVGGDLEVTGDVTVDESESPILVQTRLLQELLLGGLFQVAPEIVAGPGGEQSPPPAGVESHSDLLDLDADDHLQYLLVDPTDRSLARDLDAGGNLVVNLGEPAAPAGGEAVRWDRAVKSGDAAGGDLSGSYPDPQVAGLQGNPVSTDSPAAGEVLTWTGSAWAPAGAAVPDLPFEEELIRVELLSWSHGRRSDLSVAHDGAPRIALAAGFSGPVQRRTLTEDAFRVFVRFRTTRQGLGEIFEVVEVAPEAVLPVDVTATAGGLISATGSPTTPNLAGGVLFVLGTSLGAVLLEGERRLQLRVELLGDHVLDERGRAIDAEFPRAGLPSGDGPGGARLGLQGGKLESWLTPGRNRIIIRGIDLNRATATELRANLPGVGQTIAGRIVQRRDTVGPFRSFEELAEIEGVTALLMNNLRALLET